MVRKGREQVTYKSTSPALQYGLNTLKKNFEGLEMMYRKGYAAAEAIPAFLQA